jgi:transposase
MGTMHYVGLDVHTRRSSLCVLDGDGKAVRQFEVKGPWPAVLDRVAADVPRPFAVCFEASCGYGYLHGRLSQVAEHVAVAHPGQLRLIFRSKRKNDRVDAAKLAKLLYLDAVPRVHVPGAGVRQWRALIEHRQKLLAKRVAAKNQLRALLRSAGVVAQRPGKALWSGRGLAWLAAQPLAEAEALVRDALLEELGELAAKVARVEAELAKRADAHPGVALLRTIPGVGVRTAEAFVAYVDDVRRFRRTRQVGSYLGLVPCQDSSAGKDRLGHITGDGPATVRKLLCEAAWQAVRRSPGLRAFFERVAGGRADRRKLALVATAHKLARAMAAMLRTGEAWREEPAVDGPGRTAEPGGRRGTAGGEGLSPPEDTAAGKPLSSVGAG